jgi:hypothetical protein
MRAAASAISRVSIVNLCIEVDRGARFASSTTMSSTPTNNGPCHMSGNFLSFKGKSRLRSSQGARFFSFAKWKKSFLQRNPAHMTRANMSLEVMEALGKAATRRSGGGDKKCITLILKDVFHHGQKAVAFVNFKAFPLPPGPTQRKRKDLLTLGIAKAADVKAAAGIAGRSFSSRPSKNMDPLDRPL